MGATLSRSAFPQLSGISMNITKWTFFANAISWAGGNTMRTNRQRSPVTHCRCVCPGQVDEWRGSDAA